MPVFFANSPDSANVIIEDLTALSNLDTTSLFNASLIGVKDKYLFILDKNSVQTVNGTTIIEATPSGRWIASSIPSVMVGNDNKIDSSQLPNGSSGDFTINGDLTVTGRSFLNGSVTIGDPQSANGIALSDVGNMALTGEYSCINETPGAFMLSFNANQMITSPLSGYVVPTGSAITDFSSLNSGTATANDATVRSIISAIHGLTLVILAHQFAKA